MFELEHIPVDIVRVINDLGIATYEDDIPKPKLEVWFGRGARITVPCRASLEDQRFWLAHHLSALMWGRDKTYARLGKLIRTLSGRRTDGPDFYLDTIEEDCCLNAAELLMPRHYLGLFAKAADYNTDMMARHFRVHHYAMEARFHLLLGEAPRNPWPPTKRP
jgi:Zn-dependent peptidase ImmA (M78 family)